MRENGPCLLILNHEKGFALLTVLIFGLIIMISAIAYFQLRDLDVSRFHTDKRYWQALYAAEAGREKLSWIIKNFLELNPFHENWYPYDPRRGKLIDLLSIANPQDGEAFFPSGELNAPYFRVVDVWGEASKVYFRIVGSVDTDGDGIAGLLTQYGGGYDFKNRDEDDINRYYEGYVSLPGSLGQDISAGARYFLDGTQMALLSEETGKFITYRGETLSGFRYHEIGTGGSYWRPYRYIFSRPVLREDNLSQSDIQGKVILPKGLFTSQGDINPYYFSNLTKVYEGNQTFGPSNDPTSDIDSSRRAIIYVHGNVQIDSICFGYITTEGELRGSNWRHTDVTIISTGDLTVTDLDCGMVGRLILIAKNITLKGSLGKVVNGIAMASENIYLKSSLTSDAMRWVFRYLQTWPTYWSAYFYGTMLAGNAIYLEEGGWTVIYDKNVLNGSMFRKETLKRYAFLDNFEDSSFNQNNAWSDTWGESPDSVFFFRQGRYLESEITDHQGDYSQKGSDGIPQLMRVASEPDLTIFPNHKTGVGNSIRYSLKGNQSVDWSGYSTIWFYMALDNWKRKNDSGSTTEKVSQWLIGLKDASNNKIEFRFTEERYLEDQWGNTSYQYNDFLNGDVQEPPPTNQYSRWKLISISFSDFKDPSKPQQFPSFDFTRVVEFYYQISDFRLRWPVLDGGIIKYEYIEYIQGAFRYRDKDNTLHPIQSNSSGEIMYLNPKTGSFDLPVMWNPDPGNLASPKTLKTTDLRLTLRIDRVVIPGSNYRNYGLPSVFRYEVSRWRELSETEAMK